ncbi:MAG: recombinase family protein [Thaumarchaeota archaeon]|nr:recombinase family protein [Nitrososphaerota archaeon]
MGQEYIIYCRKSSESEERQVLSIESQIKELKQLTERLDIPISELLTESQSAKYPGRPIFNSILRKVNKGEVKGIISWKLDRLARNPVDGAALVWALDQGKLNEIVTPTSTFSNNSSDKFLMQIEFGIAKKYVDDLSDNIRRGNRAKLDKGWLPGFAPLGYMNEPIERTIVPDPKTFDRVRLMWDMLLHGTPAIGIYKIARDEWGLQRRKFKSKGEGSMCLSSIYKIFTNPFYYGLIQRREGVYHGRHVPMITEEEYWRAQKALGRKGKRRPKEHKFAFTGLVKCGTCGGFITAEEKSKRQMNGNTHVYTYYHCTKKTPNRRCPERAIRLEDLEKQVAQYLESIYVPKPILNLWVEHIEKSADNQRRENGEIQQSLATSLKGCLTKLENLNQMRLRDLISDEEYIDEKRKLIDEKIALESSMKGNGDMAATVNQRTTDAVVFAHEALERFRNGSLSEKRTILGKIGSNLTLRDKKLIIEAATPFSILQKGIPSVSEEFARIEPLENKASVKRFAFFAANFVLGWRLIEYVRTSIREKIEKEISSPSST